MSSQVVLITGCSTGIGRDLAEHLTEKGYAVVATARRLETIHDLKAELKLSLDVTDHESIREAVDQTLRRYGRIDVLINNAGYAIRGAVEEITDERIHDMFNVNVYGIIRMIRAVAPLMRKQGCGRIINIGSIGGLLSQPVNGTYCASKFAVEALSDAMRLELAGFGIRVVLIEPGNIKTNFVNTVHDNSNRLLTNKESDYHELYQRYFEFTAAARKNEPGPEAVSRIVLKAIETAKPKARYKAAVPVMFRLMPHMGDGIYDFLMKAAYRVKVKTKI